MPSRETVEAFIATVEANDHVGAIERFYAEDASMQENLSPPRVGRAALAASEAKVLAEGGPQFVYPPGSRRGRHRRHPLGLRIRRS